MTPLDLTPLRPKRVSTMRSLPARLCLLLLVACGGPDPSVPDAPIAADAPIFATTWPLEWAGDRLLEGFDDVELLLPTGADPEHWRKSILNMGVGVLPEEIEATSNWITCRRRVISQDCWKDGRWETL